MVYICNLLNKREKREKKLWTCTQLIFRKLIVIFKREPRNCTPSNYYPIFTPSRIITQYISCTWKVKCPTYFPPVNSLNCWYISSKVGLISGFSVQQTFISCIYWGGAVPWLTDGRSKGGGCVNLWIISATTGKIQTKHNYCLKLCRHLLKDTKLYFVM